MLRLQLLSRSLWVLVCLSVGCATLPENRTQRGLYVDVRKALHGEHRLGWTVDRIEIAEATAEAEPSACRVSPEERKKLLDWVRLQIAAQGGPAEARYRKGESRRELDDLIDLEHTKLVLENVEQHVPADCPFWLSPEPVFDGEHSVTHRFVLIAESMGAGSLLIQNGTVRAAGGGSARLLGAYGFSSRWELALGAEGGGDAVLARQKDGSLSPEGAFRFGVPTWLRLHDIDRIYDLELAAITRLQEGQLSPWGMRVAVGGGVTGLRRIGFMPALELWLGYEVFPAQKGEASLHSIRLGTRVGLDYDP